MPVPEPSPNRASAPGPLVRHPCRTVFLVPLTCTRVRGNSLAGSRLSVLAYRRTLGGPCQPSCPFERNHLITFCFNRLSAVQAEGTLNLTTLSNKGTLDWHYKKNTYE